MTLDGLVPEGFDLQAALRKRSTTASEDQPRCPRCESVQLLPVTSKPPGGHHGTDADYRCKHCRALLDAEEVEP